LFAQLSSIQAKGRPNGTPNVRIPDDVWNKVKDNDLISVEQYRQGKDNVVENLDAFDQLREESRWYQSGVPCFFVLREKF